MGSRPAPARAPHAAASRPTTAPAASAQTAQDPLARARPLRAFHVPCARCPPLPARTPHSTALSGAGENFFLRCAAGKHVDRLLRARAEHLAQVFDHDLVGIHRTLSWLADVRPRSAYIVARKKCGLPTISDRHMWKYDTSIFFF